MNENTILCCDAVLGLKTIESETIDLCITDPPYFLHSLSDEWDSISLANRKTNHIR